ncbi:hypothetical protein NEOKW01_1068 [Nematocida sp. AWRm80]|nr:hypothetical protein NEOKW01_1068 [Nematocida sp. AWRm80]
MKESEREYYLDRKRIEKEINDRYIQASTRRREREEIESEPEETEEKRYLQLNLGSHLLWFCSLPRTGTLFLHMHVVGTIGCTSVCKEIAYCSLRGFKDLRKKKKKEPILICSRCNTQQTPLWRKFGTSIVCNACGLYFKTHGGIIRPERLFKRNNQSEEEDQYSKSNLSLDQSGQEEIKNDQIYVKDISSFEV